MTVYREAGASWRPVALVALLCVAGFLVDGELLGHSWQVFDWLIAFLAVGGVVAVAIYAKQRFATVILRDDELQVGVEVVPLSKVDVTYFDADGGGPPTGARVVGGAWSVPRGREPLPVRLTDGTVVIVPCRDPEALRTAIRQTA